MIINLDKYRTSKHKEQLSNTGWNVSEEDDAGPLSGSAIYSVSLEGKVRAMASLTVGWHEGLGDLPPGVSFIDLGGHAIYAMDEAPTDVELRSHALIGLATYFVHTKIFKVTIQPSNASQMQMVVVDANTPDGQELRPAIVLSDTYLNDGELQYVVSTIRETFYQ